MSSQYNIKDHKAVNRLAEETSPYLLQHAYNPVDWLPWGEEAFKKAKKEDKPVFLSVGYSTCHWCHVMAHESFEDPETAALINDAFIPVKVDREERPDIDSIYMTACQLLNHQGGWPLTIIMTPEKKPFYAATYIPKLSRQGRLGLMNLIPIIKDLWTNRRREVLDSAEKISNAVILAADLSIEKSGGKSLYQQVFLTLLEDYDSQYGGFSVRPKFPSPHNILFLIRYWKETGETHALEMAKNTLDKMRKGGIFDHIGFGFHRYSTDREWLVPHFEKMLYDQGMLLWAYNEGYQASGKQEYARTAKEIIQYVKQELTSPEGGFYSAEDADSEGEEGKFYLWSFDEIQNLFDEKRRKLFCEVYNIFPKGNFIDEAARRQHPLNIPHMDNGDVADLQQEHIDMLEDIRKKLFLEREKRVHPHKDDKILTDWNGLMIGALALSSRILDEKEYALMGEKAAHFIIKNMTTPAGRLRHSFREGRAAATDFLDDYAFFVWGLLELYETTFNPQWLKHALNFSKKMIELFWDENKGGFFLSPIDGETLLARKKETYDNTYPSGNSIAYHNLLKLELLTESKDLHNIILRMEKIYGGIAHKLPHAHVWLVNGLKTAEKGMKKLAFAGDIHSAPIQDIIKEIRSKYLPDTLLIIKPTDPKEAFLLEETAPFMKGIKTEQDKPVFHICAGTQCFEPVTHLHKALELLER